MQKTNLLRNVLFGKRLLLPYSKRLSSEIPMCVTSHAKLSSLSSSIQEEISNPGQFLPQANILKNKDVTAFGYGGRTTDINYVRRFVFKAARKKMKLYLADLKRNCVDPDSIFCKPLQESLAQDQSLFLKYQQRINNYANNVEASELTVDQCIKLLWLMSHNAWSTDNVTRATALVNSLCQQLDSLSHHEFLLTCFFMFFWRTATKTDCERVQNCLVHHAAHFEPGDLTVVSFLVPSVTNSRVVDLFCSAACQSLRLSDKFERFTCFGSLFSSVAAAQNALSRRQLRPITQALNSMPKEKFASMTSIPTYLRWVTKYNYRDDEFNERLKNCIHDLSLEFKSPKHIVSLVNYIAKLDYVDSGEYPTSAVIEKCHEVFLNPEDQDALCYLISFLKSCALIGVYHEKLTDKALAQDYFAAHEGLGTHAFIFLDSSIAIECQSYSGNRLTSQVYDVYQKNAIDRYSNVTARLQTIWAIISSVMNYDTSHAYIGQILPHFQPKNLLLMFKNGKLLPAHSGFPIDVALQVDSHTVPSDETWICIKVQESKTRIRGKLEVDGYEACQRRQLLKLGYKVVEIDFDCATYSPTGLAPRLRNNIIDLFDTIVNKPDAANFFRFKL